MQTKMNELFKQAEKGDKDAQFNVGRRFAKGDGVKKDKSKAYAYYKLAADQGHSKAQYHVALMSDPGPDVYKYFKLSSDQGNAKAQFSLGGMYFIGKGIEKNEDLAYKYFKLSADQGDILGQYMAGYCLEGGIGTKKNIKEAFKYFKLAADKGYADAQYEIGVMYESGLGIKSNLSEALRYYKLSADQACIPALVTAEEIENLQPKSEEFVRMGRRGKLLVNEQNVPTHAQNTWRRLYEKANSGDSTAQVKLAKWYDDASDQPRAYVFYERAANQEVPEALYEAGLRYQKGHGTEKDPVKAIEYFLQAAEKGNAQAQLALGHKFWDDEDQEKAYRYYKLAADQGNGEALYNVSLLLDNGDGVERDEVKAMEYLLQAAETGYDQALYNAGLMLRYERSTEADESKAFEYFKRATEQGHIYAQYQLGLGFKYGWGVEKSTKNAFEHVKSAADKGYYLAQMQVSRMYKKGIGVEKNENEASRYLEMARETNERLKVENPAPESISYTSSDSDSDYDEKIDDTEAVEELKQRATAGNRQAQLQLADRYWEHGQKGEAFKYFKLAADQGSVQAQYEVGCLYELGEGVVENIVEAKKYYHLAAEKGHLLAKNQLDKMGVDITTIQNPVLDTEIKSPKKPSPQVTVARNNLATIQETFKTKLIALHQTLVREAGIDNPQRMDDINTLCKGLDQAQAEFFSAINQSQNKDGITASFKIFSETCSQYEKQADKAMGHGWLYKAVEYVAKAIAALFVGIGMTIGCLALQGFAKESHRKWYKDSFFTADQTPSTKAVRSFIEDHVKSIDIDSEMGPRKSNK